jgi:hypothetical protein
VSASLGRPWLTALGAALLFAVVTIAITWPLFRHPSTQVLDSPSLYGPASVLVQRDINLTVWILAWDTHALVTDPLHLFHANALYPARWSLATSEHMLGNVPFFAPIYLASGNPVLAHQLTLVATFVVAGLAMAAYVFYWTRDRTASLAAGCLFAFAPYRVWQVGNLHIVSIHWIPLVLLGIDLAVDGRRRAGATLVAAALALSSLCSYYVGYTAFALAGAYAVVALVRRGRAAVGALPALAAGFGVAAAVVGLLTIPYLILQREGVIPHRVRAEDFDSMAFLSLAFLGPRGYSSYFLTPRRDGIPQFLGYTVMALAVIGLVLRRRPPRGALVAGAVTGWGLTLGPVLSLSGGRKITLPYRWLMAIVPGFSAMRIPQRFGAVVTVAVTALAGLALAELIERLRRRGHGRLAPVLAAVVVVAALVEVRIPGLRTMLMPVGEWTQPGHRWLAEHGEGGALIEVPATGADPLRQSQALVGSTVHWLPLANGYSPYPPPSFTTIMEAAARLPAADAIDRMLAVAPLRWVLVRRRLLPPAQLAEWRAAFERAGLRLAAEFPEAVIFEVPASRRTPAGAS